MYRLPSPYLSTKWLPRPCDSFLPLPLSFTQPSLELVNGCDSFPDVPHSKDGPPPTDEEQRQMASFWAIEEAVNYTYL